jgi:hypothetical protein
MLLRIQQPAVLLCMQVPPKTTMSTVPVQAFHDLMKVAVLDCMLTGVAAAVAVAAAGHKVTSRPKWGRYTMRWWSASSRTACSCGWRASESSAWCTRGRCAPPRLLCSELTLPNAGNKGGFGMHVEGAAATPGLLMQPYLLNTRRKAQQACCFSAAIAASPPMPAERGGRAGRMSFLICTVPAAGQRPHGLWEGGHR